MQWQWRIEIVSDSQLCVARPEVTVPTQSSGNLENKYLKDQSYFIKCLDTGCIVNTNER